MAPLTERDRASYPEEEGGDVEGEDGVPVEDDGEAEDQVQSTSGLLPVIATASIRARNQSS